MTPKEKVKELVEKYTLYLGTDVNGDECYVDIMEAKRCALICVDEILEALEHHTWQNKDWVRFYKEVKEEIN